MLLFDPYQNSFFLAPKNMDWFQNYLEPMEERGIRILFVLHFTKCLCIIYDDIRHSGTHWSHNLCEVVHKVRFTKTRAFPTKSCQNVSSAVGSIKSRAFPTKYWVKYF